MSRILSAFRRVLVYLLTFTLLLQIAPNIADALELPSAEVKFSRADDLVFSDSIEQVSQRTAHGRFFETKSGKGAALITLSSQNYQAADGHWQPINNQLVYDNQSQVYYNKANRYRARFAKEANRNLLTVNEGENQLQLGLSQFQQATAKVSGSTITYPSVLPGIDLEYTVAEDIIKSDLILNEKPTNQTVEYQLRLSSNLTASTDRSGGVIITDTSYRTVWQLPAPSVEHPFTHDLITGHYDLRRASSSEYTISLPILDTFLPPPELGYPVRIDPTIVFPTGTDDGYVLQDQPDWTHPNNVIIPVGHTEHNESRGLFKFDLSGIPSGTTIDSALFAVTTNEDRASIPRVKLYRVTQDWNSQSATWNNQPTIEPAYESSATNNIIYSWWNFDVTKSVKAWMAGSPNYGVELRGHDPSVSRRNFLSRLTTKPNSNDPSIFRPYILVYYNTNPQPPRLLGLKPWWRYVTQSIGEVTSSVNVATGNLVTSFTDASSQSIGFDAVVKHTYNSQTGQWILSSARHLTPTADRRTVDYTDETGTVFTFHDSNGDNNYIDSTFDASSGFYKLPDHRPNGLLWGLKYDPAQQRYSAITNKQVHITFDSAGRLLEERDRNGNYLSYQYSDDRLIAITDPAGHQVKLSYNTLGQLISVTDFNANDPTYASAGGKTMYGYAANGNLKNVSFYSGTARLATYAFTYTDQRLISVTDGMAGVTRFGYLGERVASITNAAGKITTINYQNPGLTSVVSEKGNESGANPADYTTDYVYQTNPYFQTGLVYREVSPPLKNDKGETVRNTTEYDYNDDYLVQGTTDTSGSVEGNAYDDISGLLVWQTNRMKTVTLKNSYSNSSYDTGSWRLVDSYDGNGAQTTYYYDSRGNLTRKSIIDSNVNLLHNAGFESQTRTTDNFDAACSGFGVTLVRLGLADFWCGSGRGSDNRYYGVDTSTSAEGLSSQSVGFNNNTKTGSVNSLQKVDEITQPDANKDYVLSWKYRQDNPNMAVEIVVEHEDSLGNTIEQRIAPRSSYSSDWATDSFTFHTPTVNPSNNRPYWTSIIYMRTVATATGVTGRVWFDSVKLEEGTVPTQQTEQVTQLSYTDQNHPTPNGLPLQEIAPEGKASLYQWNAGGRLERVIDSASNTTIYAYDTNGNQISKTQPKGVKTADNPNDYKQLYSYDGRNRLKMVTEAATGTKTSYTYDKNGNLISIVAPNGLRTTYGYDAMNRPTNSVNPYGYGSSIQYDASGNPKTVVDPNNRKNSFLYDAADRVIKEIDPTNRETVYDYDSLNNLRSLVEGAVSQQFSYNAAGQVTQAATTQSTTADSVQYSYDKAGNLTIINPKTGDTVVQTYTTTDETTKVTAAGKTTSYTHNKNNQLTKIERPNTDKSLYDYGDRLQLQTITHSHGDQNILRFSGDFDANGNQTSQTVQVANDPAQTVNYDYGNQNQLTQTTSSSGTAKYLYDKGGNLSAIQRSSGGTTTFLYDGNRVTQKTNPDRSVQYLNYDANGNMTSRDTGDKVNLLAHLNGDTRNSRDALSGTPRGSFSYVAGKFGQALSTGSDGFLSYSSAGNLTKQSGTVEFWVSPHWSSDNILRTFFDSPGDANNFIRVQKNTDNTLQFIYMSRGTDYGAKSTAPITWNQGDWYHIAVTWYGGRSYLYVNGAVVGQRTTGSLPVIAVRMPTLAFGANLLPNPSQYADVTFDEARVSIGARSASEIATRAKAVSEIILTRTTSYEYDNKDYLTKITKPDGTVINYTYDASKHLVKRSQTNKPDVNYQYSGDRLVSQQLNDGTVTTKYNYDVDGRLFSIFINGSEYYPLTNALGSIIALRDASGVSVNQYTYDEWGNVVDQRETIPNNVRYAGYQYDPETGMYNLGARWYDPSLYRFISPDPHPGDQDDPMSLNEYLYVGNNPITRIDPDGEYLETIVDVAVLGYDLEQLRQKRSIGNFAWAGVDMVCLFLPIPALGITREANVVMKLSGHALEREVERKVSREVMERALNEGTHFLDTTSGNKGAHITDLGVNVYYDLKRRTIISVEGTRWAKWKRKFRAIPKPPVRFKVKR